MICHRILFSTLRGLETGITGGLHLDFSICKCISVSTGAMLFMKQYYKWENMSLMRTVVWQRRRIRPSTFTVYWWKNSTTSV